MRNMIQWPTQMTDCFNFVSIFQPGQFLFNIVLIVFVNSGTKKHQSLLLQAVMGHGESGDSTWFIMILHISDVTNWYKLLQTVLHTVANGFEFFWMLIAFVWRRYCGCISRNRLLGQLKGAEDRRRIVCVFAKEVHTAGCNSGPQSTFVKSII